MCLIENELLQTLKTLILESCISCFFLPRGEFIHLLKNFKFPHVVFSSPNSSKTMFRDILYTKNPFLPYK